MPKEDASGTAIRKRFVTASSQDEQHPDEETGRRECRRNGPSLMQKSQRWIVLPATMPRRYKEIYTMVEKHAKEE